MPKTIVKKFAIQESDGQLRTKTTGALPVVFDTEYVAAAYLTQGAKIVELTITLEWM